MPTKTPKKPAVKRARRTTRTAPPRITPDAIRERAYFVHLDEGGDELGNWLRAERELTAT